MLRTLVSRPVDGVRKSGYFNCVKESTKIMVMLRFELWPARDAYLVCRKGRSPTVRNQPARQDLSTWRPTRPLTSTSERKSGLSNASAWQSCQLGVSNARSSWGLINEMQAAAGISSGAKRSIGGALLAWGRSCTPRLISCSRL